MKSVNVASPAYLAKFGRPNNVDDLKHHRLVRFANSFAARPDTFEYFDGEKTRHIAMKSAITVGSIDGYKAAALAGLGIAQNPRLEFGSP
ncbi:MAG: hypothetical protein DI536_00870 [Archangium gephyra]|uniref:LysR substrate-binding domain-containing protein n=1 Tax=Archangium gephyra TaxID=48 RepID=A0A2W5U1V9_9BACT|nr:MAG: hypothetical protein DI536_00870 [Archangium gephyra]